MQETLSVHDDAKSDAAATGIRHDYVRKTEKNTDKLEPPETKAAHQAKSVELALSQRKL